jgi:hypothetical protein
VDVGVNSTGTHVSFTFIAPEAAVSKLTLRACVLEVLLLADHAEGGSTLDVTWNKEPCSY